ncbi:MAG: hypothetical protein LCH79_16275 [Proteobacteria bacterium]|nr:hypothetical protein [Pseudomonadota bacterium]
MTTNQLPLQLTAALINRVPVTAGGPYIELSAWSLFRKGGFADGDVLDDLLCDHIEDSEIEAASAAADAAREDGVDDEDLGFRHNLLVTLVEGFLLPAMPPVKTEHYCTCHNPIRVAEDEEGRAAELEHYMVRIPEAVIVLIARTMLAMRARRPVTLAELEQHLAPAVA